MAFSGDGSFGSISRQGSATGQAVEDAYMLCSLLGDESGPISRRRTRAFETYVAIRLTQAQKVVKTSRKAGDIYAFAGLAGSGLEKIRLTC